MNTNNVTNITESVLIPQDTVNDLLISTLKGVKEVGGELYSVGKVAIIKGVDLLQDQAPKVIEEFLRWRFFENAIEAASGVLFSIFMVLLAIFIFKKVKKIDNEGRGFELPFLGAIILVSCLVYFSSEMHIIKPIKEMVKIQVAPRVYVIDWVSQQWKGK